MFKVDNVDAFDRALDVIVQEMNWLGDEINRLTDMHDTRIRRLKDLAYWTGNASTHNPDVTLPPREDNTDV